ncbi:MAG: hypothetical protein A3D28_03945 [Omnitrophica bacterium RIFCSPHIGHO2_02_FULL_63_14]|nr:MAG: hypothetical protein A3D28_03945 [Omnitrophica bacterium RIFCSPHIGHO2_02_FULL_63_14]
MLDRIWAQDASLWSSDPAEQRQITSRLGWLDAPGRTLTGLPEIEAFADEVRKAGFRRVVLLGMGGSSLAPEVIQRVFGPRKGYPSLIVLDSTDPDQIRAVRRSLPLKKTLFLVSSKSGTTIEVLSLFKFFFDKVRAYAGAKAGGQFAAITDPGTPLQALAQGHGFRRLFLAPPDVGGRFSALTVFGMVPAALIGADARGMLESAARMSRECRAQAPSNPGLSLGLEMAERTLEGRDKLTLAAAGPLDAYADWIEQLIAESTGKNGKGILPVTREGAAAKKSHGTDRFVLPLRLKKPSDLGAEFFKWEFAAAAACAKMGVNAFDQPDVQDAKNRCKALLANAQGGGRLPVPPDEAGALKDVWPSMKKGDYVALLAFLPDAAPIRRRLCGLADRIRRRTRRAVTIGIGPRYLHSTGQLHKGGPDSGVFLLLSAPKRRPLEIPGEPYDFARLELAQAAGDYQALKEKRRRALWLPLEEFSLKALDSRCREILNSLP